MLFNFWQIIALMLGLILLGAVLAVVCIIVGGWIVFKAKSAVPGERFLGGPPKGEVFALTDALDTPDFPDENKKNVLERSKKFIETLGRREMLNGKSQMSEL